MAKYTGFVAKISEKTGQGKRGPWTAYSCKIQKADGGEYGEWISLGFDRPPFKEGDYVQLEAEESNGRVQFVKGSAKVSKNPPARPGKSGGRGSDSGSDAPSAGGGYNDPARQAAIVYQSSRKDAVEAVRLLLEHNGLDLSVAKTKAAVPKNFEAITAAIDKLTVQYYNDVTSLRLLESVADAGEIKAEKAKKAHGDLPDDADEVQAEDTDAEQDEEDGFDEF